MKIFLGHRNKKRKRKNKKQLRRLIITKRHQESLNTTKYLPMMNSINRVETLTKYRITRSMEKQPKSISIIEQNIKKKNKQKSSLFRIMIAPNSTTTKNSLMKQKKLIGLQAK